jgi:hypothetical protein
MKSPLPARPVACAHNVYGDEYADYIHQPKANGWRFLFDQATGLVTNRHGVKAKNSELVLERLKGIEIKARYIDGEIMGMRTRSAKGTIILIDAFDPVNPLPISERLKLIEEIEPASYEVKANALLRMPRLDHDKLKACWAEMDYQNQKAGEVLWEGFVSKDDQRYPWISNPSYCSPQWHKMRIRW